MKFLIVGPSPLPIRIPLGPKYSPQDPVFKYPEPGFLLYNIVKEISVSTRNWIDSAQDGHYWRDFVNAALNL